jgi:hypothetical protein
MGVSYSIIKGQIQIILSSYLSDQVTSPSLLLQFKERRRQQRLFIVNATLAYIRHFIFAGCYDNDPWYLVTNLAGHLDFAGFYFSKCPANSKPPAFSSHETQV